MFINNYFKCVYNLKKKKSTEIDFPAIFKLMNGIYWLLSLTGVS